MKEAARAFHLFESDVVPDSGKTRERPVRLERLFESDVVPDSGKTPFHLRRPFCMV